MHAFYACVKGVCVIYTARIPHFTCGLNEPLLLCFIVTLRTVTNKGTDILATAFNARRRNETGVITLRECRGHCRNSKGVWRKAVKTKQSAVVPFGAKLERGLGRARLPWKRTLTRNRTAEPHSEDGKQRCGVKSHRKKKKAGRSRLKSRVL